MICFLLSTYLLFCALHLLERERERSAGLTPAVTAVAAATTTAATLVMSTRPKSNLSPGPGVPTQGRSLCRLARKC